MAPIYSGLTGHQQARQAVDPGTAHVVPPCPVRLCKCPACQSQQVAISSSVVGQYRPEYPIVIDELLDLRSTC